MTHDEAQDLLLDLAYGELAPAAAEAVARHAAACAACGVELERIAAVRARAAALRDGPGPARGREALVEAARRAVAARPSRRWFERPSVAPALGVAAAVALAVGVTFQLTRPGARRVEEGAPAAGAPPALEVAPPPATAAPPRAAPAPEAPPEPPARAPAATPASPGRPAAPPPAPPAPAVPRSHAAAGAGPAPAAEAAPAPAPVPAPAPAAPAARAAEARARASRGAGELTERRFLLRCGEREVERLARVDEDGRVVQLAERAGGATAEAWYDGGGHLRASRASPGAPPLPAVAPSLEAAAARCGWADGPP